MLLIFSSPESMCLLHMYNTERKYSLELVQENVGFERGIEISLVGFVLESLDVWDVVVESQFAQVDVSQELSQITSSARRSYSIPSDDIFHSIVP